MDLEYKQVPFEKEDIQENGIFKGYGSTFLGKPDSYGDIIAHGAFAESIIKKGRGGMGISMLFQHMSDRIPGAWKAISEDSRGLKVEGQLALKTQLGQESYELLKLDALKGLSIGFDLPRLKDGKVDPKTYEIDEKSNTRLLKKINLWEISLVTFPANTRARVTGVKNLEKAGTVREFEKSLRELGLTKSQSVYIASLCAPSLRDSGSGESEVLKSLNDTLLEAVVAMKSDRTAVGGILDTLNHVNKMLNN